MPNFRSGLVRLVDPLDPRLIGILKNFTIFIGKHMRWSLFLIKLESIPEKWDPGPKGGTRDPGPSSGTLS